jgi:hypothetical protein
MQYLPGQVRQGPGGGDLLSDQRHLVVGRITAGLTAADQLLLVRHDQAGLGVRLVVNLRDEQPYRPAVVHAHGATSGPADSTASFTVGHGHPKPTESCCPGARDLGPHLSRPRSVVRHPAEPVAQRRSRPYPRRRRLQVRSSSPLARLHHWPAWRGAACAFPPRAALFSRVQQRSHLARSRPARGGRSFTGPASA